MGRRANPEDFLEVLQDAFYLFVWKAALRWEHVDMVLRIKPADTVAGREPDAAFGGDADRLSFHTRQAFGKGPKAKVVGAVRIDAEQAAFGGEIDFAPGIEGEGRGSSVRIVGLGERQLAQDSAFHVGDPARSDNPNSATGSQNELANIGAGKALLETETQNMVAVKAK